MFIINIYFTASQEEVEKCRVAHRAYLTNQVEQGTVLCFGPRQPLGTGGIVLCNAASNEGAVYSMIASDPYFINNIAKFELVEFTPFSYVPQLAEIIAPKA